MNETRDEQSSERTSDDVDRAADDPLEEFRAAYDEYTGTLERMQLDAWARYAAACRDYTSAMAQLQTQHSSRYAAVMKRQPQAECNVLTELQALSEESRQRAEDTYKAWLASASKINEDVRDEPTKALAGYLERVKDAWAAVDSAQLDADSIVALGNSIARAGSYAR